MGLALVLGENGKETAEDQPDQVLLSVIYFCQDKVKPLCQYHGTEKMLSLRLNTPLLLSLKT